MVEAVAEEAVFRGRLRWQHTDAPPTGRWRPAVSVRESTEPSRKTSLGLLRLAGSVPTLLRLQRSGHRASCGHPRLVHNHLVADR